MSAALHFSLAEQFREPDTQYLSPVRVSEFFGFQVQELAKRAHVHRNTPSARPHAPQLQRYMQDMLRALAVASELTGGTSRAVFLLRNEPLKAFDYKTADTLIQEGRAEAVIDYLQSLAGGAAG